MRVEPTSHISVGSIAAIFDQTPGDAQPVVQCIQTKLLSSQSGGPTRYKVLFGDTVNFVQTMLATDANHLVTENKLRRGVFVKLKRYQEKSVRNKKILVVFDLEVLEHLGESDSFGDPKPLDSEKPTIPADGFYGNTSAPQTNNQPQQQQQQQQQTTQPAAAAGHGNIYPIEALSPWSRTWTIKARCTLKSPIRTWQNKNGEGKLFNVNLLDESGEIRATAFREQCDELYDVFEEGAVYYISSPCRVRIAKKEFSTLNNDYELTFETDTVVEKADDQADVPQVKYNFTGISDLQNIEPGATIDVIGVLKDVAETAQIISKSTSKAYDKRELTLVDNTGYSVRLTIWGESATSFDAPPECVMAFKGVKVSDFGGRSLSLLSSGTMSIMPQIDEALSLKNWYDSQGRNNTFTSHFASSGASSGRSNPLKTIAEIRDEMLGRSETPDYFSVKATIIMIRQETMYYPSCRNEGCNKKVIQDVDGLWRCERCSTSHEQPSYRYIFSMNVCDHTGQVWLSGFDDVGRMILKIPADQLVEMKENNEQAASELVQKATFGTWTFNCRARMDTFQEQQRVRHQVTSAHPLDYAAETNRLVELIKSYNIE